MKEKRIASARVLIGQKFENIVQMCSLEPGNTWKEWFDPYGNKLKILKNTCTIAKSKVLPKGIHDIYCKSTFSNISGNSYWCCFIFCNDKDLFWFVGNDGILRHMVRSDGNWKVYPPLLSGYKIIHQISELYSIDEPNIISIEGNISDITDIYTVYITPWPPEDQIREILEEKEIV